MSVSICFKCPVFQSAIKNHVSDFRKLKNSKGKTFGFQNNKMFPKASETFAIVADLGGVLGREAPQKHLINFLQFAKVQKNSETFCVLESNPFRLGVLELPKITHIILCCALKSGAFEAN